MTSRSTGSTPKLTREHTQTGFTPTWFKRRGRHRHVKIITRLITSNIWNIHTGVRAGVHTAGGAADFDHHKPNMSSVFILELDQLPEASQINISLF